VIGVNGANFNKVHSSVSDIEVSN